MRRGPQILLGTVAVAVIVGCLGILGYFRAVRAQQYIQPYAVHDHAGSNYVVRLEQLTAGKTDKGFVVIVSLHLQNPNLTELALRRDSFILAAQNREYYLATTQDPKAGWIKVPANGVLEKEMLTFAVPDEALAGALLLRIGQDFWIMLKTEHPLRKQLRTGEFRTFHQGDW